MITIFIMAMVGKPAKAVIKQVARDNQRHSHNQQPGFVLNKKFFQYQE